MNILNKITNFFAYSKWEDVATYRLKYPNSDITLESGIIQARRRLRDNKLFERRVKH
jgi:hypothetical protein